MQFSLRAVFLATTIAALFLAWRFRGSPEAPAVSAIREASGTVYFTWQEPSASHTFFSVAMLPESRYFGQVDIAVNHAAAIRSPTVWEWIVGSDTDNTVDTVAIPLDKLTPGIADHLKALPQLRWIMVEMPLGVIDRDSAEAKRLAALQAEFPGIVLPAV